MSKIKDAWNANTWYWPGGWPLPVKLTILAITVAIPAAVVIDQCGPNKGTGGHPDAWCVPRNVVSVDVCPSVQGFYEEIDAVYDNIGRRGIPTLPVTLSACDGPPDPGHVQWRSCTDIVSPFVGGCPPGYLDTVGFTPDGAGVVYYATPAYAGLDYNKWNMYHAALHTIGYGHTSAATSVMYGPVKERVGSTGTHYKAGPSWERIKPDACDRWQED